MKSISFLSSSVKIESNINNEDASGDIEFEFQDDSEEEDDDLDDVSNFFVVFFVLF